MTFKKAAKPKLPIHPYAGLGRCCNLPKANQVHDLSLLPAQTAEQRAADAARLGERED
jgi:hypothetical protein